MTHEVSSNKIKLVCFVTYNLMMEYNIINASSNKEVIASTYADLYINYDDNKLKEVTKKSDKRDGAKLKDDKDEREDSWKSPSDLLIGIIELKPPFTSKIIKSKTHQGILNIGDDLIRAEYQNFLIQLKKLLNENDDCWRFILKNEKDEIYKKLKVKYDTIFKDKTKIMSKEIAKFYEDSLQDMEEHVKNEVQNVLIALHAKMISVLNIEIQTKLKKEKQKLENVLNTKYVDEIEKIEKYYNLLLNHEIERGGRYIISAINERTYAINVFYEQILRERLTSTMYVMCTERKKCKVKKILVEKILNKEIIDIGKKLKEKKEILQTYKDKEIKISDLNKNWEEKIKKITQILIKFISFALKLLPEQANFLLDFEKMIHLQLEDVLRNKISRSSILLEENNLLNFHNLDLNQPICDTEPFIVEGDLSETPKRIYGSRESLPNDVDLPYLRLQRQFMYAKCHGFEDIKKYLGSQRCKCHEQLKEPSPISISTIKSESIESSTTESSDELFLFEDFHRLPDCPDRRCNDFFRKYSFPCLNTYLNYTEENFKRVEAILGVPDKIQTELTNLNPGYIAYSDLPFAATKEKYHTVGTQYSSEDDIRLDQKCSCIENATNKRIAPSLSDKDICIARKNILNEISKKYPKVMTIFAKHDITF